jgi:propionate CoA-transferase
MQGGLLFGASINAEAHIDISLNFDILNSGVLDLTVLGLAETDQFGNVNVSKFGPKIVGPGGFIDMTSSAKEIVFCGTMTAGDLQIGVEKGKLKIIKEGSPKKFVKNVEQISFSGDYARKFGMKVLYVTERAVFELRKEGFTLVEIAPGIDIEKHILPQMDFKPLIAKDLKTMDPRIFAEGPMGIRDEILAKVKKGR